MRILSQSESIDLISIHPNCETSRQRMEIMDLTSILPNCEAGRQGMDAYGLSFHSPYSSTICVFMLAKGRQATLIVK